MSPILGIWASAQQPALNATSFESIATVTVGSGGVASAEFTSIPSTYKHLQIRAIARNITSANDDLSIRINSDTGTNYSWHTVTGTGTTPSVYAYTSQSLIQLPNQIPNATDTFAPMVIDILEYANTNIYKTVRTLIGFDINTGGRIQFGSGNWRSTSAITSIKLYCGSNLQQYSHFALYGIKGA